MNVRNRILLVCDLCGLKMELGRRVTFSGVYDAPETDMQVRLDEFYGLHRHSSKAAGPDHFSLDYEIDPLF